MSPRVAYWTSAMHPEMEAVASEVALLRQSFPMSLTWGITSSPGLQCSWRRGFAIHPRMHLAFRASTFFLQRAFHINHLFGGLGDWFHLVSLRSHPSVLTLAVDSPPCDPSLLERIDQFVVEWPEARDTLSSLGIERERTQLIFPPVNLKRFQPTHTPDGPLKVLFASSPDHSDLLAARGIPLLLSAAERLPHVTFRLLWRPWGNSYESVAEEIRRRELLNVELQRERITDMAIEYQNAHATIAPFTDMLKCKPVPNSLIESLACGRPVILTNLIGVSNLIQEKRCGIVCPPTVDGICDAIERVSSNYNNLKSSTRTAAEKWFSEETFIQKYRSLYSELL